MHIPWIMDQQPTSQAPTYTDNTNFTCMMDLTGIILWCTQLSESALQHQPLPHLPPTSSCPLPTIPTSTQPEQSLSPQNQHHQFFFWTTLKTVLFTIPTNFYLLIIFNTVLFTIHKYLFLPVTQMLWQALWYNTPYFSQQYPPPLYLPTIKEPSAPSTPTYIPILTGRSDWCPWSEVLATAIMTMNLFGHIVEHYDSQWGFNPGSVPTIHWPSIKILHLMNFMHGIFGGHETVRFSIFSSHACHLPYICNYLVLDLLNLDIALHALSTKNSFVFLVAWSLIWLMLFRMSSLPCTVPPHVLVTRFLIGGQDSTAWFWLDICLTMWTLSNTLSSIFLLGLPSISSENWSFSTLAPHTQLNNFHCLSIIKHVMNVELNHTYFQPSCSCHINSDTTSSNPPKDNTTTTPSSTTTPTSQLSCQACSANFCTICRQTGHTNEEHKPGGSQDCGVTDQNKPLVHAYVADVEADPASDGGAVSSDQLPLLPSGTVDEDSPPFFAALGTAPFVPPTSTPSMNNNIYFDLYRMGVISAAFTAIPEISPICLLSIYHIYNLILDSGCTYHIIMDQSLFWTYHTSQAIPVKTANCGVLETLVKGDIKVWLHCGSQSIVLVFHDCLHTPSTPINLILVSVMQERQMHVHFNEDATVIHFPSDHPTLAGLSFQATVLHRLSFLQCDFITPVPLSHWWHRGCFPNLPSHWTYSSTLALSLGSSGSWCYLGCSHQKLCHWCGLVRYLGLVWPLCSLPYWKASTTSVLKSS